jgi:UDP-glucuronate 4-epimerase
MAKFPQRILVTGGGGFIGSHLAEALLRAGTRVWIVDDLNDFYSPARKRANLDEIRRVGEFEFEEVDIRERGKLRAIVASAKPQAIVHLAARAGVRPSLIDPHLYQEVNVAGSLNLLDLSKEFGVSKFVFGSSSSVYGIADQLPFSEGNVALKPISPYAATKLAGEMLCFTYAHLYQLPIVCLRFFTVYGPRQRPDLAIYKFTELIEEGKAIPVFGDGSTGRDYTFVSDIVAGVVAALRHDLAATKPPFEIVNLGNSSPVKLQTLVEILETEIGKKAEKNVLSMQQGDVPITWADISKAKRLFGWSPQVPIATGLRRFVDWYRAAGKAHLETI